MTKNKRPIVLVHGWKMSHRIWDRTVAALEGCFRVVSFDLREFQRDVDGYNTKLKSLVDGD